MRSVAAGEVGAQRIWMPVFVRSEEFLANEHEMSSQSSVYLAAFGEQCVGKGVIAGGLDGFVGVGQVSGAGLNEHAKWSRKTTRACGYLFRR